MLININKLKVILIVIFLFPFIHDSYSQRIKWEETFESEDIVSKGWRIVNRDSSDGTVTFFSPFEFFKLAQQNAYKGNYFLKLNFENANSKMSRMTGLLLQSCTTFRKMTAYHSGAVLLIKYLRILLKFIFPKQTTKQEVLF